jgi:hypothetical protein
MQTELLIARLARQARPVRVVPATRTLLARWAVVSAVSVTAGVAWYGLRRDAVTELASGEFLVRALITTLVATAAARHALRWSVPGMEPEGLRRLEPALLVTAWASLLILPLLGPAIADRIVSVRWHPQCAWQMASVAIVPAAWMFWRIGRAAPYALTWTSTQAALASVGAAALAVQLICGLNGAAHQLVWHVGSLLAITGATALAGRLLLRRY